MITKKEEEHKINHNADKGNSHGEHGHGEHCHGEHGHGEHGHGDPSHELSHAIIDSIKSVYIQPDPTLKLDQKLLERKIGELIWEAPQTLGI